MKYETKVPLILNGDMSHPFSYIHLRGELLAPTIHFIPSAVQFNPVPLSTEANIDVKLVYNNFNKSVEKLSIRLLFIFLQIFRVIYVEP